MILRGGAARKKRRQGAENVLAVFRCVEAVESRNFRLEGCGNGPVAAGFCWEEEWQKAGRRSSGTVES